MDNHDRQLACDEVEDLIQNEDGMTDWEVSFVESMSRKINSGGVMSDREIKKVHEIWDKVCK